MSGKNTVKNKSMQRITKDKQREVSVDELNDLQGVNIDELKVVDIDELKGVDKGKRVKARRVEER